jgi:hypothetical protein
MNHFENLNYNDYYQKNMIDVHSYLNIDMKNYGLIDEKRVLKWESITDNNTIPIPPELDDLVRLHYLIRSRKVRTILEFGVGKSSFVMTDALKKNKIDYSSYVADNLRIKNSFECHSVENNESWLSQCVTSINDTTIFKPHLCELVIGEFNSRLCTYYLNMPNIRPDFIYLDGPDQYSANGDYRGLHTRHFDRMPMAADILTIEHFLEPGTMILVDGRTANARFLKCNLQRNWDYEYIDKYDQHFFVLDESPLGYWNNKAIEFTKGNR